MNFDFLMNALFPMRCLRCRIPIKNDALCEDCRAKIKIHSSLFCGVCKARLRDTSKICHKDSPYILGAAGSYSDETIKALIHSLKFRGIRNAAKPLAEIIEKYLSALEIDLADYSIIPIPLSSKRQRERGFNQSELIGTMLAAHLGIPIETKILVRIRHAAQEKYRVFFQKNLTAMRGAHRLVWWG
jgi:predicted amidophosphoribosyltransferase